MSEGLMQIIDATWHAMRPGTHEWPRTPECRCGAPWDQWNDRCTKEAGQ